MRWINAALAHRIESDTVIAGAKTKITFGGHERGDIIYTDLTPAELLDAINQKIVAVLEETRS
jgi:hypothetical protein